ncbi:MAG: hypothetical protein IID35_03215 [Planctomycetes bacterium]|nr:hypothetical protein [Planctomycetota bacterium]
MPFHLYQVQNEGEKPRWFGVRIEYDEDHWMSSCCEVDREGNPLPEGCDVAPKFYGMTAEQVNRRMVEVLERSYEEVAAAPRGIVS